MYCSCVPEIQSSDDFDDHCYIDRLKTILSYDRICVLEGGELAEMDTPENLFANPNGIFRGMCERSSITFEDISAAQQARRENLEGK